MFAPDVHWLFQLVMTSAKSIFLPLLGFVLLTPVLYADDARRVGLDSVAAEPDSAKLQLLDRLISQLGSQRYVERRRAQQQLRQVGIPAFDRLHAASSHVDPEIAAAAGYLLGKISIPWVDADDSPAIRSKFSDYANQSNDQRVKIIEQLADMPRSDSVAALCRIVRFDSVEYVSRTAATALLRSEDGQDELQKVAPVAIATELGSSSRRGADWLRLYLHQQSEPQEALESWREIIDEEANLVRGSSGISQTGMDQTTDRVVVELMWHLLDLCQELDQTEQALDMMARILDHDPDQFETTMVELIDWFSEIQAWEALDELLTRYQQRLAQSRRPQYVAAIARQAQGRLEEAQQLAAAALHCPVQQPLERLHDAQGFLLHRGQWEWAEQEYRATIDAEPIDSPWSLIARTWLANLLFDTNKHQRAAEALQPLEERIEQDTDFRNAYNRIRKRFASDSGGSWLMTPKRLAARRHFFLAAHFRDQRDNPAEQKHLRASIELDPQDADVVIAMYGAHGTDDAWRDEVRTRIAALTREFQREIDNAPDDSMAHNQWAWLVSNTEGDFQKAIRYSQRSLDLLPEGASSAGYLDTLGRCYFAAGDYKNAVKYQREAVAKDGSMQVLQRQLDVFETALASQKQP
jgi:tetratricopeptide (TPR) repeat protein